MFSRNQVNITELHGKIHPHNKTIPARLPKSTRCLTIKVKYDNNIISSPSQQHDTWKYITLPITGFFFFFEAFELKLSFKEVLIGPCSTYLIECKAKGRVLQVASVLQRNGKTQRPNKCWAVQKRTDSHFKSVEHSQILRRMFPPKLWRLWSLCYHSVCM